MPLSALAKVKTRSDTITEPWANRTDPAAAAAAVDCPDFKQLQSKLLLAQPVLESSVRNSALNRDSGALPLPPILAVLADLPKGTHGGPGTTSGGHAVGPHSLDSATIRPEAQPGREAAPVRPACAAHSK